MNDDDREIREQKHNLQATIISNLPTTTTTTTIRKLTIVVMMLMLLLLLLLPEVDVLIEDLYERQTKKKTNDMVGCYAKCITYI